MTKRAYSLAFTCPTCGEDNLRPEVRREGDVQIAVCENCGESTAAEQICSPGDRLARAMRSAERLLGMRL